MMTQRPEALAHGHSSGIDKHPAHADNWKDGHTQVAQVQLGSSDDSSSKVPFRQRFKHLTWAWFTLTMSTGGLALLLKNTPHRFHGLDAIGKAVFILDLVFFVLLVAAISYRFFMTPVALKLSLLHPTESLFFPCSLLSIATILVNSAVYGIPASGSWLAASLHVCFWIYVAVSTLTAVGQFFVLFKGAHLPIHSMTPAWILPVFPAMLSGTVAAAVAPSQSPEHRLPILVAGVTYQGLGWTVATLIYPLYLGRLMQDGLPAAAMRPGMFIAVGPAGFTITAVIGMSRAIPEDYGYFAAHPMAPEVLRIVVLWLSIWIWCIGFWFFAFSLVAVLGPMFKFKLPFSMTWWAFVFPNVGFTVATTRIGEELNSEGILWVASALTVIIAATWVLVLYAQVVALARKKILWPGRDEDKDQFK